MPPVVRDHEGVQTRPGVAHAGHEVGAFADAALGEHDVGECVVGPGLFAAHVHGVACGGFGAVEQVALLPAKGEHAVQVGHVGSRGHGLQRQAQHAGGVAPVEQMVLAELEGGQVARVLAGLFFVQGNGAGHVTVDPGSNSGHKTLLAVAGLGGVGKRLVDEGAGVARCVGRFGKHVQRGAAGLHDGAGVLRRVQHIHRAGFAGDEAFDEVVQRRCAGGVTQSDGVAQAVGQ